MADRVTSTVWVYRGLFVLSAAVLLFVRLLPLESVAGGWPGPDLVLVLTLAWVLRRPDYVPVLLIAGVVLLEDLLLMRPPGLWSALVVLASEFLRNRATATREYSFLLEWAIVGITVTATVLGYRLLLAISMLPQVSLAQTMVQLAITLLCYPVVVAVSRLAFGVRKPATGEVDGFGRRL